MKLTAEQIYNYQNDGVILIKQAFISWIEKLKIGFDKVLKNPGIHKEKTLKTKIMEDFLKITVIGKELMNAKDFILNSPYIN